MLLFIHEMGHVIALRREGVEASAPVFIPFLGAVVWAKSLGGNALAEARVGLAGPILGTIGAAACLPIAAATGSDLWQALAFTGFFLNLFNLLPVTPLDGGRAMAALAPWMWFVGLGAIVVLALAFPNPIILIIAVGRRLRRLRALDAPAPGRRRGARRTTRCAGATARWSGWSTSRSSPCSWWLGAIVVLAVSVPQPDHHHHRPRRRLRRLRALDAPRRGGDEARTYYEVRPRDRALVGLVYLALIAVLVVGMDATHLQRSIPSSGLRPGAPGAPACRGANSVAGERRRGPIASNVR